MFRPFTNIEFQQLTGDRHLYFKFGFCNQFSVSTTWVDLTNDAKVTLPKNIYVLDQNGVKQALGGTTPTILINDLFQRGDRVRISYGYDFDDGSKVHTQIFEGYISKVTSKKPIQLELEDNMWVLKQTPIPRQVWPASKPIQELLQPLLTPLGLTIDTKVSINVGSIIIENESVAQFLMRIRKDYHIESVFVKDNLVLGFDPYAGITPNKDVYKFIFQYNIISDELDWQRKDDVKLSAVVQCVNTTSGGTNKKGEVKTKKEHLSVLVFNKPDGSWGYSVKKKDEPLPENVEGERRTLFFPSKLDEDALNLLPQSEREKYLKTNIVTPETLFNLGKAVLSKYYYDGFKGKFTTFAHPYVKIGDTIYIEDSKLPDRNGKYNVKAVEYTGGINGHRQIIQLDYKLITKK